MADELGEDWWKEEDSESNDNEDIEEVPDAKPKTDVNNDTSKQTGAKKKRKRKRKTITEELKETGELAATPADVVRYLDKEYSGKLTAVEKDEIALDTAAHFYQSNSCGGFPVAYLRGILTKWKRLKAEPLGEGSPLLLIISSSALRAVQLNRQIQEFKGDRCKSAKLFAKHMKLEDQQAFLKKSVCHIGVGTPNRIHAVLKSGHLRLSKLLAIVLDWNWRDVKQRRLVDIPEVRAELATLMKTYLIPHIKSNHSCKIGIL